MRWVPWSVLLLCPCVIAGPGCGPAVEYRPGRPVHVVRAPATGVYELYRRGVRQPVHDTVLLKGDKLGFRRDAAGKLTAIAERERYVLAEGKYRWQFEGYAGKAAGDGVDAGGLVSDLLGTITQALILGTIETGIDAGLRANEDQGLTKYQKKKLRQLRESNPSEREESEDP